MHSGDETSKCLDFYVFISRPASNMFSLYFFTVLDSFAQ